MTANDRDASLRHATARLLEREGDDEGGAVFEVTAGSGQTTYLDTSNGEHRRGQSPVEVVLSALAACTGADVISMLRKARQDVTDYRIEVRGMRADEHPRVFTDVEVVHVVTGRDLRESAVRRAVDLSSTKYCSVSAMLAWGATVTHRYEIVEAA